MTAHHHQKAKVEIFKKLGYIYEALAVSLVVATAVVVVVMQLPPVSFFFFFLILTIQLLHIIHDVDDGGLTMLLIHVCWYKCLKTDVCCSRPI